MDHIKIIVRQKVDQYQTGFNLYRFCYYDWIIKKKLEKYAHLGDPLERQKDIRLALKTSRKLLVDNQTKLFAGTDQILKDGTIDEKN